MTTHRPFITDNGSNAALANLFGQPAIQDGVAATQATENLLILQGRLEEQLGAQRRAADREARMAEAARDVSGAFNALENTPRTGNPLIDAMTYAPQLSRGLFAPLSDTEALQAHTRERDEAYTALTTEFGRVAGAVGSARAIEILTEQVGAEALEGLPQLEQMARDAALEIALQTQREDVEPTSVEIPDVIGDQFSAEEAEYFQLLVDTLGEETNPASRATLIAELGQMARRGSSVDRSSDPASALEREGPVVDTQTLTDFLDSLRDAPTPPADAPSGYDALQAEQDEAQRGLLREMLDGEEDPAIRAALEAELAALEVPEANYDTLRQSFEAYAEQNQRIGGELERYRMTAIQDAFAGVVRDSLGLVPSSVETVDLLMAPVVGFFRGGDEAWDSENNRTLRWFSDRMNAAIDQIAPNDPARDDQFMSQLGGATGSLLGFYVAGAARIPVWAAGAASQGSIQHEQAIYADAGARYWQLIFGLGLGASEAIPVDRAFRRMSDVFGPERFAQVLANSSASSMEEFIQEFSQSAGEDLLLRYGFGGWLGADAGDPTREISFAQWLRQGGLGAITGAAGGMATSGYAAYGGVVEPIWTEAEIQDGLAQIRAVVSNAPANFQAAANNFDETFFDTLPEDVAPANIGDALREAAQIATPEEDAQVAPVITEGAQADYQPPFIELSDTIVEGNRRLAERASTNEGRGFAPAPRTVIVAPVGSGLPDIAVGDLTFDDWIAKTEALLPAEDITRFSRWYEDLRSTFDELFPGQPVVAERYMIGWLAANQAVSPTAAMRDALLQNDNLATGTNQPRIQRFGAVSARVRSILAGQTLTDGVGAKISDFIDSGRNNPARMWTGNAASTGAPFVVDRHTARDTGIVDNVFLDALEARGYAIPEGVQVDFPEGKKISVNGRMYENRADFGRRLTDHLNSIGWQGRNDWQPREVQAVGWHATLRLMDSREGTPQDAVAENTYTMAFEIVPGDTTKHPLVRTMAERLSALPVPAQNRITRRHAQRAQDVAFRLSNTPAATPVFTGQGGWQGALALNVSSRLFATREQAQATAASLGYLLDQDAMFAARLTPATKSSKTYAITVTWPSGEFTRAQHAEAFDKIRAAAPEGLIDGFTSVIMPDGSEGIRIVAGDTGAQAKKIRTFLGINDDMVHDESQPSPMDVALGPTAFHPLREKANAQLANADVVYIENDWTKEGTDYENHYRDATGRDFPAELHAARKTLHGQLAAEIYREEQRSERTQRGRVETLAAQAGSQPFADEEGNLTLTHWSDSPRPVLDPAQAGSGPLLGGERRMGWKHVFLGAGVGQEGGYRKENLGPYRHELTIPATRLYNLAEDPMGLRANEGATSGERVDLAVARVREIGYAGYFNPNHEAGAVVGLFNQAAADSIVDDRDGSDVLSEDFDAQISTQADITETPEFRAWFGDSQVVDENGQPLVVYHSTKATFEDFMPMSHFGTAQAANDRVEVNSKFYPGFLSMAPATYARQRVIPTYLSMQNPLSVGAETGMVGSWQTPYDMARQIMTTITFSSVDGGAKTGGIEVVLNDMADIDWNTAELEETRPLFERLASALGDLGYDGITYENVIEDPGSTSYIALRPEQIKGVFNRGEFDANNPDFLAAEGTPPREGGRGTASNRAPYKGEPTRPTEGIPADESNAEIGPMSLQDISRRFRTVMNVVANQGRFTLKGSEIMGQYNRKQGTIRLRNMSDVSTLFHEAGHDLYDSMDGSMRPLVQSHRREILRAAEELYESDLSGKPREAKLREGYAELFRLFVQNREAARQFAPGWTKAMEDLLTREAPKILSGINDVGTMYKSWKLQSSSNEFRSMIASATPNTTAQALMQQVHEKGARETASTIFRSAGQAFVNDYVDHIYGLQLLTSRLLNATSRTEAGLLDLKIADDPGKLAQLVNNFTGSAMRQMTTDGVMRYHSTEAMAAPLQKALEVSQGVKEGDRLRKIDEQRQEDFAAYLVARRVVALEEKGDLERDAVNASPQAAQQVIKEMESKYGDSFTHGADLVRGYGRALWVRMHDAGLITPEQFVGMEENEFYVPLLRDMSDTGGDMGTIMRNMTNRTGELRRVVFQLRGSDRRVIDPMQSLIQKTIAVESMIAQNDVRKALARLTDRAGREAGRFVENIPATDPRAMRVSTADLVRKLTNDDSIGTAEAEELSIILQPFLENNHELSFFRHETTGTRGEPIIFYRDGGKVKALQINDQSVAADVVNALNGLGSEAQGTLFELMALSSNVFRAGITSWPDFILVNFVRDQLSSWTATDVGFKPFWSGLKGVGNELLQTEWARKYNIFGGIMGGAGVAQFDRARIARDLNSLTGKGYLTNTFEATPTGMLRGLAHVTEVTETGTRIGVFKAAYERALADGLTEWEAGIEAAHTATDIASFGLHGSKTLAVRRLIPFLNANIQGLSKFVRTLGSTEVARRRGLMFALRSYFRSIDGDQTLTRNERRAISTGRKAWMKMASFGLIGALIHFLFKDDEDYQEASEYLRVTGWVIPTGNGRLAYIPKPFEWAIFSNIIERGLEAGGGDQAAMARMRRGLQEMISLPTQQPLITAMVEHMANRDFFFGRELIPQWLQAEARIDSQLAVNAYTSQLARDIGEITGWRPIIVDHYLSSMGASAARDASTVYNQLMSPVDMSLDAVDAPILRRFIRDASRSSTAVRDFWERMSGTTGTFQGSYRAYSRWLESGNPLMTERNLAALPDDERAYALLNEHFSADEKRLHPLRQARDISSVVSQMRRDIRSEAGLADTDALAVIQLSASDRTQLSTLLQDYATRAARNSLILIDADGWGHRDLSDLRMVEAEIAAISPTVRDELLRRRTTARIYDDATIQELWPEARERLLADGEEADLESLSSGAGNW